MSSNPFDFYRYLPVSRYDRQWGLYVTGAGSQTGGPGTTRDRHPTGYEYSWRQGRVFADEFGVLYLTEGAPYEFESEATGKLTVEVGDVFLLFPHVWHRYRTTGAVRHTHVWATFGGSYPRQLQRRAVLSPRRPVLKAGLHESVLRPYQRMLDLLRAEPVGLQQMLAAGTLEVLGAAAAVARSTPSAEEHGDAVRRAVRHLEQHVEDPVDLEALSVELELGYDQFRHAFKQRTGLPPYQYHLQLRINRAKDLLRGSDLSVKQVALRLQFDDPYHFSRIFKKKTGRSPAQWRGVVRRGPRP